MRVACAVVVLWLLAPACSGDSDPLFRGRDLLQEPVMDVEIPGVEAETDAFGDAVPDARSPVTAIKRWRSSDDLAGVFASVLVQTISGGVSYQVVRCGADGALFARGGTEAFGRGVDVSLAADPGRDSVSLWLQSGLYAATTTTEAGRMVEVEGDCDPAILDAVGRSHDAG